MIQVREARGGREYWHHANGAERPTTMYRHVGAEWQHRVKIGQPWMTLPARAVPAVIRERHTTEEARRAHDAR